MAAVSAGFKNEKSDRASSSSPGRAAKPESFAFVPFAVPSKAEASVGFHPVPVGAEAPDGFRFGPHQKPKLHPVSFRSASTPKHVRFSGFGSPFGPKPWRFSIWRPVKLRRASGPTGLLYEAGTLTKAWGKPANVRFGGGFVSHPRRPLVLSSKEDRSAWAAASGSGSEEPGALATHHWCHAKVSRAKPNCLWITRITGVTWISYFAAP